MFFAWGCGVYSSLITHSNVSLAFCIHKFSKQVIPSLLHDTCLGTPLDTTGHLFSDVGAGAFSDPNRNSPIEWHASEFPDTTFFNERTIAQSPTGERGWGRQVGWVVDILAVGGYCSCFHHTVWRLTIT